MKKFQDKSINEDRRNFIKLSSGGAALSMAALQGGVSLSFVEQALAGEVNIDYGSWDDLYGDKWVWDKVSWGSHNNQCLPASCSFRVYSKNGVVWREEQTARSRASGPDYPDFNPSGCQKGCGFHNLLTSPERLRYPMKRVGERGEGKWQRVSWDEAITEVADAILDAHQEYGPRAFTIDAPHVHAGSVAYAGHSRLSYMMAGTTVDLNTAIGDDHKGNAHVFGSMRNGFSADNLYDAELIIMSHSNWAYTAPPMWHFITEARYNGTETVLMSPDFSPSSVGADIHLPVKPASDAAFWLAVCQVIIEEDLVDMEFAREQTDMPLLVRKDNGKFLNAEMIDGGRGDQCYFYDLDKQIIVAAPRGTLAYNGNQAMQGEWSVTLGDGSKAAVETVFDKVTRMVNSNYRPEQAAEHCGITAKLIRQMARKVAKSRTHMLMGLSSAKEYHGDLQERAALMALGLTGNWGKPGTGFTIFLLPEDQIDHLMLSEDTVENGGMEAAHWLEEVIKDKMKETDPDVIDGELGLELSRQMAKAMGDVPASLWFYYHAGYSKLWDRKDWSDPDLKGTFGDYLAEAKEKGFLDEANVNMPSEHPPQVLMYISHNPLRRNRSGRSLYLEELFPKAKMIFSIETRMSSSAAYSDILLPAAWYYEKDDITSGFGVNPFSSCQQQAVEPIGEAKAEWQIYKLLTKKMGERAMARGMKGYIDNLGLPRSYSSLYDRFTMNGALDTNKDVVKQMVDIYANLGIFPKDYSYEQFAEDGLARWESLGNGFQGKMQATDVVPDKPIYAFGRHLQKKQPYPTYTRRAQFYIDHDWFIESGEALPAHKEIPFIGGDYPFRLISGHARVSVHTLHIASPHFMKLHRGQPVAFINDQTAKDKGIKDGDMIRIFNDFDDTEIMASLSAAVGPNQVVIYMWEPFQFKNWKSHDNMLIGMPKPTLLAFDYPQLKFSFFQGGPAPCSDRNLRIGMEKAS